MEEHRRKPEDTPLYKTLRDFWGPVTAIVMIIWMYAHLDAKVENLNNFIIPQFQQQISDIRSDVKWLIKNKKKDDR